MNLKEIENLTKTTWVPIIRNRSAFLLQKVVGLKQPKTILEIGTCIGYSGILMLNEAKEAFLTTIEIDEAKSIEAKKNFEENGLKERVEVINDDAKNVIASFEKRGKKFDFIFLDGPKGQYLSYLQTLKKLLNCGGILVCDDIFFHGYVKGDDYPKHKHRTIITRLRSFIKQLTEDKDFETKILDIEDGVSISCLRHNND